jgi:hypothetical protein
MATEQELERERLDQLHQAEFERRIYQDVFCNPNGKAVLADLLNRLGFFSADPSKIDPNQIAVANWLLAKIGIATVSNLSNYVDKIGDAASFIDLQ